VVWTIRHHRIEVDHSSPDDISQKDPKPAIPYRDDWTDVSAALAFSQSPGPSIDLINSITSD
jgi:hypothetical protein